MNKLIVVVYEDEALRTFIKGWLAERFKDYKIVAFPNRDAAKAFLVKNSPVGIVLESREPYRAAYQDEMIIFIRQNAAMKDSFIIAILKYYEARLPFSPLESFSFYNYDEIGIPFDHEEFLLRVNNQILRIERLLEENSKPDLMERGEGEK